MTTAARKWFGDFATGCAKAAGTWQAFVGALLLVWLWAIGALHFGFLDQTWQLVINTATTIITFWMVFLIQHAQNRDTAAMHAKLDELIRAVPQASNSIMSLERANIEDIEALRDRYAAIVTHLGKHNNTNRATASSTAASAQAAAATTKGT